MKFFITCSLFIFANCAFGQQESDSTIVLNEVKVKAFEAHRNITEVAAPVNIIGPKELERFDNSSLLPAFNIYPGIRMEERSSGSYRISIRGSSVRSPFGVRNVKVYWNDIPFTDANGSTYFNLLDINTLGGIEIIKGPSASTYGAGIGGVLLIDNKTGKPRGGKNNSLSINTLFGAYNTQNRSINFSSASEKMNHTFTYAHAGSDGYRDHSKLNRDVFNWQSSFFLNDKYTIHLTGFYADMNYDTPGGLNLDQKNENPQQARQATKFTPSSEEQKAGIKQKLLFFGISQEIKLSQNFTSSIALFGSGSDLENPFITNYEFRKQNSFGARNKNNWLIGSGDIKTSAAFGFEFQKTNSSYDVYDNEGGIATELQYKETVDALQSSIFAQMEFEFPENVFITAGLSLNSQKYDYQRENGLSVNEKSKVPLMPRLSVLKSFSPAISIFGSVGRGFSSPTVEEFVTGFRDQNDPFLLAAESGTNYEFGLKGQSNNFSYEASYYILKMNDAIIRGTTENGEDFFKNAGETQQKGLEILGSFNKPFANHSNLSLVASLDLKNYKYLEFSDRDNDYSGNEIPSVPKTTFNFLFDYSLDNGLFWNNNLNFTDKIPLNNANSVYADSYWLYNSRIGWKKGFENLVLKLHFGADNIFNQSYSLGNDTNAFGSRYYNPSPEINWNTGASLTFHF